MDGSGEVPSPRRGMSPGDVTPPAGLARWATGVLLGAGAGLAGALADVASTVLWLAPGPDRLRLVLTLVTLGTALCAVTGGLVGWLHDRLVRWRPQRVIRHAVVLAVPLGAVAHWLFSGGRMRRLPAQWVLQPLAAVGLVTVAAVLVPLAVDGVLALRARTRMRGRTTASLGAGVLALALHGADHRVLPRLYEYLHAGLGVLTALAFAAALAVRVRGPVRPVRVAWVTVLASVALAVLGWRGLSAWANVRAEVFGPHAPFVRHGALAVAAVTGAREGHAPDSLALRRARLARARREPAGGQSLPCTPGAHVLLITVDAMRADRLGRVVHGRSLTPTLDALAAHGVVFQRAYAQAPHSSYSLSSLHTGEYLHETIPLGQAQPRTTLADALGAAGYHTAALYTRGIFFTEGDRLTAYRDTDFGFVRAVHVDRDAGAQAAAAMGELDDLVRRGEPPGLVWVHFFDAHAPYAGQGDTPEARYDDGIRAVDRAVATLLDHARRVLARDLVVAVTADHGEEFGEHGGVYHGSALYDEQTRVPLVIAAPGYAPRRVPQPVELIDVAPTLAALVGIAPPRSMRGRDLRARMAADTVPHAVFAGVNTRKMVLRWPYKLIADLTYGVDELYDLAADPGERRNLAGARPDLGADLHGELDAWLESLVHTGGGDRGRDGPLARGRMGDRGAAQGLLHVALDPHARGADRTESVDLLATLGDGATVQALRPLLGDADPAVAGAAAVALGARGDASARAVLRRQVVGDPPALRHAAARALARLGDPGAVPGLIELLWSSDESQVLDALRDLGRLHDPAALEAVLTVLPDDHLRYRAVLALGQLRDARAYPVLADLCLHDATDDVRANAVAALGALGDRRAVPTVVGTLTLAHAERYAAEALGALGVVGTADGGVDGFDARRPTRTEGFTGCGVHEDTLGWRYLGAASCVSVASSAGVTVTTHGRGPRLMVLRARRGNDGPAGTVAVSLDGREVARTRLSPQWEEARMVVPGVPEGDVVVTLTARGPAGDAPMDAPTVRLDHLLLLPLR